MSQALTVLRTTALKTKLLGLALALAMAGSAQAAFLPYPLPTSVTPDGTTFLPSVTYEVGGDLVAPVRVDIQVFLSNVFHEPGGSAFILNLDAVQGDDTRALGELSVSELCDARICRGDGIGNAHLFVSALSPTFTISGSIFTSNITGFLGSAFILTPDGVTISAVPGPLAGAGILPLLGLLVWGWRRQTSSPTA
jgi:hypothetical protein